MGVAIGSLFFSVNFVAVLGITKSYDSRVYLPILFRDMSRRKLSHAPLQEVIFELFWKLPLDESGFPFDPVFELAQGVFASRIKRSFPLRRRTLPEDFKLRIYPKPVHQFWKEELTWPVVQLGPGILTVNDTDVNYVWKGNFQKNIKTAIRVLRESYGPGMKLERARLQYIDAVEFDPKAESAVAFIDRNLNVGLRNQFKTLGKSRGVRITQEFDLKRNSRLLLNIQSGTHNKTGQPAIIWTTAVEKSEGLSFGNLNAWLEFAHQITSDTFVNMLNTDFYASFDR